MYKFLSPFFSFILSVFLYIIYIFNLIYIPLCSADAAQTHQHTMEWRKNDWRERERKKAPHYYESYEKSSSECQDETEITWIILKIHFFLNYHFLKRHCWFVIAAFLLKKDVQHNGCKVSCLIFIVYSLCKNWQDLMDTQ